VKNVIGGGIQKIPEKINILVINVDMIIDLLRMILQSLLSVENVKRNLHKQYIRVRNHYLYVHIVEHIIMNINNIKIG
jgi:hypothetical protein